MVEVSINGLKIIKRWRRPNGMSSLESIESRCRRRAAVVSGSGTGTSIDAFGEMNPLNGADSKKTQRPDASAESTLF
jgi:hypothetical protein